MWGFITCLNDVIIPHLKVVFDLNYAQAMMIQFAFFTAYFVVSLPSSQIVRRVGYKNGIIIGLVVVGSAAWPSIRPPRFARTRSSCWPCSSWLRVSRCCKWRPIPSWPFWASRKPHPLA